MELLTIPCRDAADSDEYPAGEQLTEDDAEREPAGLEPTAAHHRDRRRQAERAQGRNHRGGDQVSGRVQHEYAAPSRRLFGRFTLTIVSLPARAPCGTLWPGVLNSRCMSFLVFGGLVALMAAGCGSTKTVTRTVTVPAKSTSDLGPPAVQTQFGYIKSMTRKGAGYVLRFDPALLLSGITANTAAAEDGAVAPGEPVPNDNYRLNEGHRLLTYLLPANAR